MVVKVCAATAVVAVVGVEAIVLTVAFPKNSVGIVVVDDLLILVKALDYFKVVNRHCQKGICFKLQATTEATLTAEISVDIL